METLKPLDSFRATLLVLMWALSTASLLRRERNCCIWHSLDWTVQLSKHQVSSDPDLIPFPQPIYIPPQETTQLWKILPQGFVFLAQCTAHSRCLIISSQSIHPKGSPTEDLASGHTSPGNPWESQAGGGPENCVLRERPQVRPAPFLFGRGREAKAAGTGNEAGRGTQTPDGNG